MSKFIITTDSSCDCSIDELKQKNIPVVFYEYTADSKTFVDDMNEVNYKNFYNNMRNGVVYKTSQINPQRFYEFFKGLLDQNLPIIHVSLGSGLSNTVNSAHIAINMLQEDFPSCKIKVIENKDKIFAESGKEIEKQLDTKTVASFAQKSKIMNHLLLKKNAVMLTYMLRQNISYDTLYQIRQDLIQHKIINSATPFKLAYYKQNFFVNALTTMRNQGDLNKTDLLLIDLMKLNPDLICQFFISNFDKLELIYPEKFPKGEKEKGDKNN